MTAPDQYDAEAEKALPCSWPEESSHWCIVDIAGEKIHCGRCPAHYRPAVAQKLRETAQREYERGFQMGVRSGHYAE